MKLAEPEKRVADDIDMNLPNWKMKLFDYCCFLFFNYLYYPLIRRAIRLLKVMSKLSTSKKPREKLTLHTLPYSPYCEKIRWVLDQQNEVYEERPHGLMTFMIFGLYHTEGKSRKVPFCIMNDGTVKYDSTDILVYLSENQPEKYGWLYPNQETSEIEEYLDTNLGKYVMGLVYQTLFTNQAPNPLYSWKANLDNNIPYWEKFMFNVAVGTLRFVFRKKDQGFRVCWQQVKQVFSKMDDLLKDRKYLANTSHITAADLTFASLAYPILCPEKMNNVYMKSEKFPAEFQAIIDEFRDTKAGKFALNLYQNERSKEQRVQIKKNPSGNQHNLMASAPTQ